MLRQIRLLLGIQLCNLFGFNQVRYTKDKKKRAKFVGMAIAWLILGLMFAGYIALFSFGMIWIGMPEVVPVYLFMITAFVIFFFSFFKAAGVLFQMNSYEVLVSLPVSGGAIVTSRFLTMYVTNLILSALVMLPGLSVYAVFENPKAYFYLYSIQGILLLPLLPITAATALGVIITAVSVKMKHKSLVSSFLTVALAVVLIAGSAFIPEDTGEFNREMLNTIAQVMKEKVYGTYPPADWFGAAVTEGSLEKLLWLLGVSAALFGGMIALLNQRFLTICNALNATSAKNNYRMKSLSQSSPLKALFRRELRRYFASSVYVSNTVIGYVLMVITAIALFVMGIDKIEVILGLPGIVSRILPFVIALMAGIMPTTSCSISMEGKQWWLVQSLPVTVKDLWNSKILVNLTVALPFYLVSVFLQILTVRPGISQGICFAVIPAVYILFTAVLGITINLLMPVFEWENETRVVKQSASTVVTMFLGFIAVLVPAALLLLFKEASMAVVCLPTAGAILAITTVLYHINNRRSLLG